MKSKIVIFCAAWLWCLAAFAQIPNPRKAPQKPAVTAPTKSAPATTSTSAGELQTILNDMDRAATGFKSAQADFVWDQFTRVVNEHDQQKGVVYYRRQNNEVQMAADITSPAKKYVLFSGGKVDVYQPDIEQVTEYSAGKNKAEFESFLVLGFGAAATPWLVSFFLAS
jgi:outer membrane lipoprotein-sorting protein